MSQRGGEFLKLNDLRQIHNNRHVRTQTTTESFLYTRSDGRGRSRGRPFVVAVFAVERDKRSRSRNDLSCGIRAAIVQHQRHNRRMSAFRATDIGVNRPGPVGKTSRTAPQLIDPIGE